jgi:2,4-dienoyl-CoA reductase-like NADH-dependent reductase (Old Yellow Enzyme family)
MTSTGFTIAVKLNSADFQRGGFDLESSMLVAEALEAEGIDLLEVSGGSYEKPAMMGEERESTKAREAFFLEYAEQIRQRVSLPLMVTGGFRTRAAMDAALASGATDLIGMARPLAVRPEVAGQLVRGEIDAAPDHHVSVGNRKLDGLLQIAWHQRQMTRMGLGLEPNEHLGSFGLLAAHLVKVFGQYIRAGVLRDGHALDAASERPLPAGSGA